MRDGVDKLDLRGQWQARMFARQNLGQRQHLARYRCRLSTQPELLDCLLHQPRRRGVVSGLEGMSNGLGPLSLCLIKAGGPAVQDWHYLWGGGVQSREQGFAKEIM